MSTVGSVDCVLLSHLHADHTDLPTLRALERSGPVLAPYPAREWLARNGLRDVRELIREMSSASVDCGSRPPRPSTTVGGGRSVRRPSPSDT